MDAGIASIDDTQTQGLNMSAFVRRSMVVSALLVGATLASSPALAQRKSAQDQRKEQMAQIPTCARPLGSISVLEPEDATNWWTGQQLPAPSKLIKVFVSKSRCFTLVDRGAGMNAAMRERELAAGGELRQRSNLGKGQIKAADYVLVPDLIGANSNAGGNAVGGLPDDASAANASQAMRVTKPARLLGNAKGSGKAVRELDPGALLYPTGNRDGAMIEVEDELGNRGWISSNFIELAK